MSVQSKMDPETLAMVLDTLAKLEKERFTITRKLEMDQKGEFPLDLVRFMLGPEVALHLIFIPSEYGGLGAGTREIAIVSEKNGQDRFGHRHFFPGQLPGHGPDPGRIHTGAKRKVSHYGS